MTGPKRLTGRLAWTVAIPTFLILIATGVVLSEKRRNDTPIARASTTPSEPPLLAGQTVRISRRCVGAAKDDDDDRLQDLIARNDEAAVKEMLRRKEAFSFSEGAWVWVLETGSKSIKVQLVDADDRDSPLNPPCWVPRECVSAAPNK